MQVGPKEDTTLAPFSDLKQDACIQLREEAVNAFSSVFIPPGTFITSFDIMSLLYGAEDAARDDVQLHVQNNDTMQIGFGDSNTILGKVAIGSEIKMTPHAEGAYVESLGKIAMRATVEAKCAYAGDQHVVQYAVNKLVKDNKFVRLSGFNLAATKRAMVGCSGLRLKEEFIEEITKILIS